MTRLRIEVRGLCCFVWDETSKTLTALLLKDHDGPMHEHEGHDAAGMTHDPHVPRMYIDRKHLPGGGTNSGYAPFDLAGELTWPGAARNGNARFPDRLTNVTELFGCKFKGLTAVSDHVAAIIPLPFNVIGGKESGDCVYHSAAGCPDIEAGILNYGMSFETELDVDELEFDLPGGGKTPKLKAVGGEIEVRITNLPRSQSKGEDPKRDDPGGSPLHFLMLYSLFNGGDQCGYYPLSKEYSTKGITSTMFTCMPGGGS